LLLWDPLLTSVFQLTSIQQDE